MSNEKLATLTEVSGRRCREERERCHLTSVEVSNITGITRSTISKIETGMKKHVNPEHILKFSALYKVSYSYLLGMTSPRIEATSHTRKLFDDLCNAATKLNDEQMKKVIKDIEKLISENEKKASE